MRLSLLRLTALAALVMTWSACGDDDPAAPGGGGGGGTTPFNTSQMPLSIPGATNGSGNISFDGSGNIILASDGGDVHRISRSTGERVTIADAVAGGMRLMCCVYDKSVDRIYACTAETPTSIYSINPTNGDSGLLVSLAAGYGQQMLFAPSTFGAHAGKLLVLTYSAGIYAFDPTIPGVPTVALPQEGTDMEFAPDGVLYVADYTNDRIVTVSSAGAVVEFAPGIDAAEGIAINGNGTRMFVASTGSTHRIYDVAMPAGTSVPLVDRSFTGGTYPTGMLLDGHGKLIFVSAGAGEMLLDFIEIN